MTSILLQIINFFKTKDVRIETLENEKKKLTEDLSFYIDERNTYKEESTALRTEQDRLNKLINELNIIISSKDLELKQLKKEEEEEVKPSWLYSKMLVRPKRRFTSLTKDFYFSFDKAQWCYDKSAYLTEILTNAGLVGCEKTVTNAQKIHDLLTKNIVYERDTEDNWRTVVDTLLAKFGDCEDSGGIVLTSAYGICGWKADEVFNACGTFGKGGHSYCVVKINGFWYVSEGTSYIWRLDKWKNCADYKADYGLCNWKFEGRLTNGKTRILDDNEI